MTVITVSRQLGSGGDDLAARLCELLGYRSFDKELMAEVAAEVGLCEHEVVDFSEDRYEVRHFLTRLFRADRRTVTGVIAVDQDGEQALTIHQMDDAQCAALIRHTILAAYNQGNMVIVGRGGQAILQDKPDALHIRVVAPLEARMRFLQQKGVRGIAEIKQTLAERDRATAAYLDRFHSVRVDDPALYHLVINTARLGIDAAAQAVAAVARQMAAQPVP